jgi:MoaA/NifB/PqqE/SkfB family radical SAM enzyme
MTPKIARDAALAAPDEGLAARNNRASALLPLAAPNLTAFAARAVWAVPPPLSVQLQVSAACATRCVMCDQWRRRLDPADALSGERWRSLTAELAGLGVGAVILSGGEPLMRYDIVGLTRHCREVGLAVGMFTSGTTLDDMEEFTAKIEGLRGHLSWVSISVDGLEKSDARVRRPLRDDRMQRLEVLTRMLRDTTHLEASVTLQQRNFGDDHGALVGSLLRWGAEMVNFKFATGGPDATGPGRAGVLLTAEQIRRFLNWAASLEDEDRAGTNLDYLLRCFDEGVFDVEDCAQGTPVKSFYESTPQSCVVPYLSSLIDVDGGVYACCHLFRDNHGTDPRALAVRDAQRLGSVRNQTFAEVWNGDAYVSIRQRLQTIVPTGEFAACGECTRHCQQNRSFRHWESPPSTPTSSPRKPSWL